LLLHLSLFPHSVRPPPTLPPFPTRRSSDLAADTAAAGLGTGLLAPGPIQLTLGTGAQLVQLCPEPLADPTGRTHLYRAADGVNWYRMAAVQNAGLALDWVHRILGASWDELYASAGTVAPGAGGGIFLPYLTRERAH